MNMISEQVEGLRDMAEYECHVSENKLLADTLNHAADTIEMLSEKAREPKQGEWIEREVIDPVGKIMPMELWQSARCSICGKYHTTPYMYYFDEFNFCPNCGSRNRKEDE